MLKILAVGAGGFLGSVLRYLILGWLSQLGPTFPWATLVVNVSGCFVLGLVAGLTEERWVISPEIKSFVIFGLLGAFTTFSTFSYETMALLREGQMPGAAVNIALSVLLGLFAVWLGSILGRFV